MAVRPIDANELYRIEKLLDTDIVRQDKVALNLLEQVLYDIQHVPTLTPQNEPLTMEQLREMGGKPYWHVGLQEDSKAPHWVILDPFFAKHIENYGYGKRWLAYRRPPEKQEDTDA